MPKKTKNKKSLLVGVGFDHKDGHKRVTKGEKFLLVGGSEETHGQMQEKAIKFDEHLKKRGKQLEELSRDEFNDIAHKLAMPILEPRRPQLDGRTETM